MQTDFTIIDDRYEVLAVLGRGGFATVFRARQMQFDRIVALKLIKPDVVLAADPLARFEREARVLSTLRHRNLPLFYGFGHWNGMHYLATEYIKGKPLLDEIDDKGRLDVMSALIVIKQVCSALACAHANGVIHRDISPNNVLLVETPAGTEQKLASVKVIDFGLAKDLYATGLQKVTEAGTAIGSVLYMSPEQCTGGPVDARSDIYGVGCLLYYCLTGTPPFQGEHSVVIMQHHVETPLPRLADNPGLLTSSQLADLQLVLDQATAKNPERRFSSIKEMEEALINIMTDRRCGVTVPLPDNISYKAQRSFVQRKRQNHRHLLLPIACTSLVLATAAIYPLIHKQAQIDDLSSSASSTLQPAEIGRALKNARLARERGDHKVAALVLNSLYLHKQELSSLDRELLLRYIADNLRELGQPRQAVAAYDEAIAAYSARDRTYQELQQLRSIAVQQANAK